VSALLAPLLVPTFARAGKGYLRYPDLHESTVIFAAEGDLWTAPVTGGTARRVTTHVGTEYFPHFAPGGDVVAFTGAYDGNSDVFVVPVEGGEPRRLTWHPSRDEVIGWTPDGDHVLFRSRRIHPHSSWQTFRVSRDGGDPELIPLGRVSRLAVDPGSGQYAISRTNRERSTWKRYRGGTATDIWVGTPEGEDFRRITTFEGMDLFPMWHDGRIWYVSDRGGTYNLWSMRPDGSDRTRHTDRLDWDVRWPAMAPDGRIVFMLGADLWTFDPATGEERAIEIELPSERVLTRRRYPGPGRYVTWFDLSPSGERLAVVARGEIFSVPVEEGITLPVSRGSGARESWATFDPESEKIAYVTDAAREEEIHAIDSWGRGEAKVLKKAGDSGWHFPPIYSPDGKRIAFADQTHRLYVMPAGGGEPRVVDRSEQEEIRQYAWSPDGRFLAYAKMARTDFSSVFVHDVEKGENHRITGDETNDYSPAWDPDGRHLYFLSDRVVNPMIGQRDFQNVDIRPTQPFLVLLKKDAKSPFRKIEGLPPDEDEEEDEEKKGKKEDDEDGDDEDEDKEPTPVEIDWEGLSERIVAVPADPGNYGGLTATASHLYYLSWPVRGMADEGEDKEPSGTLETFDLEEQEEKTFVSGVSRYDLEAEAGKVAIQKKRGDLYVVDAGSPPGEDLSEGQVSLDDVVIELDPHEEWEQIYYEGWRHMRDFYWDEDMAGVDWEKVRDRYATLLPRLATRSDLSDLMGEVIGELSTSHTYRWGGDPGASAKRVSTGLLGADLVREGDVFRIERILRGAPNDLDRSPLDEPGVDVKEGDYLLAVNREPFTPDRPFPASLENLAGRQVLLTVGDSPDDEDARDVVVTPVRSERRLRYIDWVRRNREYVLEKTDGRIGYIHIPDMGTSGLTEFDRWFYPQLDREGMIVDCRWNAGGFVSQIMLERFRRKIVSFDRGRGGGVYSYPYKTLNGPFVVLLNEEAGSDGDIFPYAVQYEGLAPVIGLRSWGGVVGMRGDKLLVDGGALSQPEYAWWDVRRGWAIENYGVDPDIEVVNYPHDVGRGIDAQLDRGIEEVLRLHWENPPVRPDFSSTPIPDKSRDAYRRREGE
jgi:tricorn protease